MKPNSNERNHNRSENRPLNHAKRVGAALAILLLVAVGCSRLDIEGPDVGNQRPNLIFVNVPVSGTEFTANPVVYWYGTDVDGRVVRYDYAVLPESTVEQYVEASPQCAGSSGAYAERFISCATESAFQWISIFVDSTDDLPTRATVQLSAAFDTLGQTCDSQIVQVATDTLVTYEWDYFNCVSTVVPQYMFLRAVDDLGAISQIKYRSYMRRNRWPETTINPDFEIASRTTPYFSQPELTQTYRGIEVTWSGSDRADFLIGEPPLEFYWRVYGPFDYDTVSISDTLIVDELTGDTLSAVPVMSSKSDDPRRGVWVTDTVAHLYDLWHDYDLDPEYGPSDTTRTAHFLLVVTARDDAFVPDYTPDWVRFRAIDPKFERDVLVASQGMWNGNAVLAIPTCQSDFFSASDPSCLLDFWERMAPVIHRIAPRGFNFDKDWAEVNEQNKVVWEGDTLACRQYKDPPWFSRKNCFIHGPTLDVLARHRLLIYSHEDMDVPVSAGNIDQVLAQYLDVGGMVWLIDRIPFMQGTEVGGGARIVDFTMFYPDFRGRWPIDYFNIEGIWFPSWRSGLNVIASLVKSNDEFIGGTLEPNFPSLPSRLDIDEERLDSSYVRVFRTALASQSPPKYIDGVPGVPFALRGSQARTVYRFRSWRPEQNNADGAVVMTRFVGPSRSNPKFKTAWLGCPLYFLQEDQVEHLIEGMLRWFLVEDIVVP